MFLAFVLATLVITYYSARKSTGTSAYFAAGRRITAWQNGLAVAGDYMSAASFLGIAGMIAFNGYDGFMYSVGWLVAYLTVLLIVAEPLRNAGKYTMADVLAYRLNPRPVRAMASLSTITVSTFYMIAQMVGAGALVKLLLPGVSYEVAVAGVGVLMIIYVVFGGMLATTWVQIIKAVLLMSGSIFLSILVMKHFGFSFARFFEAISQVTWTGQDGAQITRDFLQPGLLFKPPYGAIDLISLGLALVFGTAGLPHILVRFYTVPDAKTARISVVWAMIIIGLFYIMTTFLGFGAATILTPEKISVENMSAPLLAHALGGEVFFAFISAVAFATILAVVAGLTISASTSFAHDFFTNVLHHGKERRPGEEVRVARITAFFVGAVSIFLAIKLREVNVAFLVGLAFAVAASANLPVIVLSIFWRRFNTTGAVAGLAVGLVASIVLIIISPSVMGTDPRALIQGDPLFPLKNPGILSIPLGFLAAVLGT
ncbi:MAG: cation acetate symporter, partial [Verrucomicrobiota bacterium]|nr:cation acetate symporter [Verrucomicrobiota bacterium]